MFGHAIVNDNWAMPRSVAYVPFNIRRLRLERHWSQTRLGRRAGGICQTEISDYERGLFPTPERLDRIAKALGVTTDDLSQALTDMEIAEVRHTRSPPTDTSRRTRRTQAANPAPTRRA